MQENEIKELHEDVQSLRETVAKLHAHVNFLETKIKRRIDTLEKRFEAAVRTSHGFDELLQKYCDMLSADYKSLNTDCCDAFSRIANLEIKLFPHLATDLQQLRSVIGDNKDMTDCPHERRKP